MPHIHLETTADLEENANVPDILEALTEELSSYETIPSKGVKAVHSLRSVWCIGEGGPAGFAHCEVAILQGRPLELRQAIANSMMEIRICRVRRRDHHPRTPRNGEGHLSKINRSDRLRFPG